MLSRVTLRKRVALCGKKPLSDPAGGRQAVQVRVLEEHGGRVAHFAGLHLCGAVWLCPVCGPKVRQRRAVELDQAAGRWLERYGAGSVMLLTLTLPHDDGEPLAEVLGAVREGYGLLMAGRAWQQDKATYGLAHYVRAHDCTYGGNGWHPHVHAVLFARRSLTAAELARLHQRLATRWADAIASTYRRRPDLEHGVQLEAARSLADVNRYVCQVVVGERNQRTAPVAYEVARGDLKTASRAGHLTPWQILELTQYADTRDDAADLWGEWEAATKGVHAIRWSKGLRKELELEPEATDEEIVAEEVGGDVVYEFTDLEWYQLTKLPAATTTGVLEAAEAGGGDAVRAWLAEAGITRPPSRGCDHWQTAEISDELLVCVECGEVIELERLAIADKMA